MVVRKSLAYAIIFACSLTMTLDAGGMRKKEAKSNWEKITESCKNNKKILVGSSIAAFIGYCIMQGDIPFVDIPVEWLNYFDVSLLMQVNPEQSSAEVIREIVSTLPQATSGPLLSDFSSELVTETIAASVSATPVPSISSFVTESVGISASYVKELFAEIPHEEIVSALQDVPYSVVKKISGAEELFEQIIRNGIDAVSEVEIDSLLNAINEFKIAVSAGTQTLTFWESAQLLTFCFNDNANVCNALELIAK